VRAPRVQRVQVQDCSVCCDTRKEWSDVRPGLRECLVGAVGPMSVPGAGRTVGGWA
jgi:hypothetical protein